MITAAMKTKDETREMMSFSLFVKEPVEMSIGGFLVVCVLEGLDLDDDG